MSVDITIIYAFLMALLSAIYLHRALFVPIGRVLDERADKLKQDAAVQSDALAAIDTRLREYDERMSRARKEAWDRREVIRHESLAGRAAALANARQEAESTLAAGRDEIAGAATGARAQLEVESARLAHLMAERILGRPLGSGEAPS